MGGAIPHTLARSPDDWLALCKQARDAARVLLAAKQPNQAWLSAGFAVEYCLKAAIMKKERLNRWPDPDIAPDLYTHNLRILFGRLGIDPFRFDPRHPVAPALKTVLDWRRDHGYAVGKLPIRYARDICRAAFDGDGVIAWIASLYHLNI